MAQLNFDAGVVRFKANEERVDIFTNNTGTYTTSGGTTVKTMPQLAAEFQAVIDTASTITGSDGWSPIISLVTDSARIVMRVTDWTGGTGTKPTTGLYIGSTGLVSNIASAVDVRGAQGATGNTGNTGSAGSNGTNGTNGWNPVLALITDSARIVLQVIDWTGGTGTKPTTGLYIGSTGLVVAIADAVDIRGPAGSSGGSSITVQDEGSDLTTALTSMNFVGAGVVATNSSGAVTVTIPGLSYVSELRDATSPNDVRPIQGIIATGSETNIDLILSPKGRGSIVAANIYSGSEINKRGTQSVDLQLNRDSVTKIAGGYASALLGGSSNLIGANAQYSAIVGGGANNIQGNGCFAGGGNSNSISSQFHYNNAIFGASNSLSGSNCIIAGLNNTINADYTAVFGARSSIARLSTMGLGCVVGTTNGRYQWSNQVLAVETTSATQASLRSDTNALGSNNTLNLVNNAAMKFRTMIVARDTSTNDVKEWMVDGLAKRGASAATTALVGTPTVTSTFADSGASAWAVAVTANTTNGSIDFMVTGEASKTIRWSCSITAIEVR